MQYDLALINPSIFQVSKQAAEIRLNTLGIQLVKYSRGFLVLLF
jgi:hypothetical protein